MRAGAFSELRVIHLLNRRFVPFYFNTGGPGLGRDSKAEKFVKGKVKNKWAHFAVFDSAGTWLGESDVYAAKDDIFEFLRAFLRQNPDYNKPTAAEAAIFAKAKSKPGDLSAQIEAAKVYEELGEYASATACYATVMAAKDVAKASDAFRGRLRISRYEKGWDAMAGLIAKAPKAVLAARGKADVHSDIAMEQSYARLAKKDYDGARTLLGEAIKLYPKSPRMGELRFYLGVAHWFRKEYDLASFHWCWIVETIPNDHMYRRAYITAAHRGMPYPNPELGGYQSDQQFGSIEVIDEAYEAAKQTYLRLKAKGVR